MKKLSQRSHPPLRAGAARTDITPRAGVQVTGAVASRRQAKYVLDRLYARALVLESGEARLCIVSADLTMVTKRFTDMARSWAQESLGIDADATMVHATQTHSAPSLGGFMFSEYFDLPEEFDWLRGGDEEYSLFALGRMQEAMEAAADSLQEVSVGYGSGVEGRLAHNRRGIRRDGRAIMPGRKWREPLGPTEILHLEGPIDPEVGVICFRERRGLGFPAIMANYACHPVHVFPRPVISADWPGALCRELEDTLAPGSLPMVLNGPCGNINPWPPFDPDYVEDHHEFGRQLARTVEKVIDGMDFRDDAGLGWASRTLRIPLREIEEERLERARGIMEERPEPAWLDDAHSGVDHAWVMAAGLIDLHNLRERDPEYDYEIQIFRIGDAAIVGLPGEPFVEGGLRIKMASPAYPTYVAHDVNHYAGYLPIREAFPRGGHETETGTWSRFVPGALDMVVEAAGEMLGRLFPPGAD